MSIGKLGLIKCGSNIQQCPTLAELTADATATASQIADGATAYVQGQKVTGTYTPPTLAELTADATATAAQIAEGATAYVKGVKVTGTMPQTINVAAAGIKFGGSTFSTIPDYFDFSAVTDASGMFTYCYSLTSVRGIDFTNVTNALNMFKGCAALAHIHNDSTISCALSFADSPLLDPGDAESYILGRLADLTGEATKTLTFNTALQSGIPESSIQAAVDKNWAVNFADSM